MSLPSLLCDSSRPVFLMGCVPPGVGTSPELAQDIATKFSNRARALALDGYIVYDVQDESARTDVKRPFRYRQLEEPSAFAKMLRELSCRECVVYRAAPCLPSKAAFEDWLDKCVNTDGHAAINVVGAPTSKVKHAGPSTKEASLAVAKMPGCRFGAVCLPERHTKTGAEHVIMAKKASWGAEWFITQGIYDPKPIVAVLNDYGRLCREKNIRPKRVVLTFTPCGRRKTMDFIKWLGMKVPPDAERRIFASEDEAKGATVASAVAAAQIAVTAAAGAAPPAASIGAGGKTKGKTTKKRGSKAARRKAVPTPVQASCDLLCENLRVILAQTRGSGVPLGLNVESVSGYRDEIDATFILFRRLQAILLDDSVGTGWSIRWDRTVQSNNNNGDAAGIAQAERTMLLKAVAALTTQQAEMMKQMEAMEQRLTARMEKS